MVVRDDVALIVPDETRPGALRYAHDVARPEVADVLDGRDEDDGRTDDLENVDRGQLVVRQAPTFGDLAWFRACGGKITAAVGAHLRAGRWRSHQQQGREPEQGRGGLKGRYAGE